MFTAFTGLGPLLSHFGLGAGMTTGLAAAAWFSPVFKRYLAAGAIIALAVTLTLELGVRDEKHRCDAKTAAVEAQVRNAVARAKAQWAADTQGVSRAPPVPKHHWFFHKKAASHAKLIPAPRPMFNLDGVRIDPFDRKD